MRLQLLLPVVSLLPVQGLVVRGGDCSTVSCRPGRECRLVSGLPSCLCRAACPHRPNPVCGSDGVSYENHCLLHRAACRSDRRVAPLHPGTCRGGRARLLAERELLPFSNTSQQCDLPGACFENDRNRLREFMMDWLRLGSTSQSWHRPGMSRGEELWSQFHSLDTSGDGHADSAELLQHLERGGEAGGASQLRQLCLDALVEEGDRNFDWRLSFPEYRALLSPSFKPSAKLCSLDKKMFEDGAETRVDCNCCVCACGKWICTGKKCSEHQPQPSDSGKPTFFNEGQFKNIDY